MEAFVQISLLVLMVGGVTEALELTGRGKQRRLGRNEDFKELEFARMDLTLSAKKVFRFAFDPNMFRWELGDYGGLERPHYKYVPFLRDQADIPKWMKYKYSERHKKGFLYGVPPRAEKKPFDVDVVALNALTYEYGLLRLTFNVTQPQEPLAPRGVKLKIDNLNLEDLFDIHRLINLKNLFRQNLWNESSSDLHLTLVASSLDVGYRRPLEPSLKDGVVAYLCSKADFSQELLDLDRETSPLRVMPSCPRDFKRTSVERHFRAQGFALDWCEFRLLILDEMDETYRNFGENTTQPAKEAETPVKIIPAYYQQSLNKTLDHRRTWKFLNKESLPESDWTKEYILILLPTLLLAIFLVVLCIFLFCVKCPGTTIIEHEDQKEALTESFYLVIKDCFNCCEVKEKPVQSAHIKANQDFHSSRIRNHRASSVQRQTDTLRRLAQQRDVTPRLQTPAPGSNAFVGAATTPYGSKTNVTTNPSYDPNAPLMNIADDGGPVMLLSDDGSDDTSIRGDTPEGSMDYFNSRQGFRDPLGSLPRPKPPAYYDRRSATHSNENIGYSGDEEAAMSYLV